MTSASPSSFARARLSISNNKAMESLPGPACQTPYLKADGTRQKRQEPAAPRPRAHNAPGRSKLASPRQPPFEERRAGLLLPSGVHPWPGPPGLRSDGTAGPARSFPSPGKARTGRGWPLGCLWPAAGAVLAGLGAVGAAEHGRLVATASARMRRGWSSLKCGSLLSLTPASLPRRAVARKLFLCLTRSHALPSPSFSCSALRPP